MASISKQEHWCQSLIYGLIKEVQYMNGSSKQRPYVQVRRKTSAAFIS
jgi:hypothetical protein